MAFVLSFGLVLGFVPVVASGAASYPTTEGYMAQQEQNLNVMSTNQNFQDVTYGMEVEALPGIGACTTTPNGVELDDVALQNVDGEDWIIVAAVIACFLFGPCSSPAY